MRFLPLFRYLAGVFILVGSGEPALWCACWRRRRACSLVLMQRRRCGRTVNVSGQGQLDQRRGPSGSRLERRRGHCFGRRRSARSSHCRARASSAHSRQCRRSPGSIDLHFSRDRRSWRGGRRYRHRGSFAGPGAAPARADRSIASHADWRTCSIDWPSSRPVRRGSARAVAAPLLAECHRGPHCRGGARRPFPRARRNLQPRSRRTERAPAAAARPRRCLWSAPVPAIRIS